MSIIPPCISLWNVCIPVELQRNRTPLQYARFGHDKGMISFPKLYHKASRPSTSRVIKLTAAAYDTVILATLFTKMCEGEWLTLPKEVAVVGAKSLLPRITVEQDP